MKIIIYDAEVFPQDSMFGFLTIYENGSKELFQTWDPAEIKEFYYENCSDSIFVGHNNLSYDNAILEAMIKGKNPYEISQKIVKENIRPRCYLNIISFDNMRVRRAPFSLKTTEIIAGKALHQSDVDFDIPRPLTLEEKLLTEDYNKDDLEQTLYNFERFNQQFNLRVNLAQTFNIPLKDAFKSTEAQIGEKVLGIKRDDTLKYKPVKPKIWPTLKVKNQELLNWYLNEEYMNKEFNLTLCGCELTLAKGGIHGAILKSYWEKLLYGDVSGFYNRIMMELDLFPRSMTKESKDRYYKLFKDQLEMKKDPTKKNARKAYKTILLCPFGAMNNEYTAFYDPYHFYLVTLSGQLYLVDLLEKLDGLVTAVNVNTDGVMVHLDYPEKEQEVRDIIKEWEDRTGFEMEIGFLYKMFQRDVNAYFCLDEKGEVDYKGEVINYITDDNAYGSCKLFDANNPPIVSKGLIDYLLFDITPEETVEKYKNELINFQYAVKKGTFDWLTCDRILLIPKGKKFVEEVIDSEMVKPLNRVFAAYPAYVDEYMVVTRLIKHKDPNKKGTSQQKVANLPDSVFIYNEDITNPSQELLERINYQYYIDKIYEKVLDYIPDN